jgi:hypothetical protein
VEEKGYKNMINLPDWLNNQNKNYKMRKSLENGRILLFPAGSFSPENRNNMSNPV